MIDFLIGSGILLYILWLIWRGNQKRKAGQLGCHCSGCTKECAVRKESK